MPLTSSLCSSPVPAAQKADDSGPVDGASAAVTALPKRTRCSPAIRGRDGRRGIQRVNNRALPRARAPHARFDESYSPWRWSEAECLLPT
eukprot:4298593-Prymnesium_polylepis.1